MKKSVFCLVATLCMFIAMAQTSPPSTIPPYIPPVKKVVYAYKTVSDSTASAVAEKLQKSFDAGWEPVPGLVPTITVNATANSDGGGTSITNIGELTQKDIIYILRKKKQ